MSMWQFLEGQVSDVRFLEAKWNYLLYDPEATDHQTYPEEALPLSPTCGFLSGGELSFAVQLWYL